MQLSHPPVTAAGRYAAPDTDVAAPRLWLADITPATLPDWVEPHRQWLSASEVARLERIARPERRAQLLAGHVLLRHLVAACTGAAPRAVVVESQPDGRAQLAEPVGWQVSLAHSGRWVAALAQPGAARPGVDIEGMRPDRKIEAIVELACAVEAESREQAYLLWTQREAELKAASSHGRTWVASWNGNALAVCAAGAPAAAVFDLGRFEPAVAVALTWTTRPKLPTASVVDGR